jgi:hypothetical protein
LPGFFSTIGVSLIAGREFTEKDSAGAPPVAIVKSVKRTDAQSDAVRFWTQTNLGPAWFQAATQVSSRKGLALAENARSGPEEAEAHDENAGAFQKISAGDGFGFHGRSFIRPSRLNLKRAESRG